MSKNEFLTQLEKKLNLISSEERKDILTEYGTYIDDKIASGVNEQEAVAGFGDLDELAKEILDAYKINTETIETKTDKTLDRVYSKTESFFDSIGHFSINDFFHIVFDVFILLIILLVGRVVLVEFLLNLFISLLFSFSGHYMYGLTNVLMWIGRIIYFVGGIFFFIRVMSRRIQRYRNKNIQRQVGVMTDIKDTWNQETKQFMTDDDPGLPPIPQEAKPLYHERVRATYQVGDFGNTLLKIIIVCFGISVVCALVGFMIAFCFMWYVFFIYNAFSYGVCLALIGFILGSISILWFLHHVWPRKEVTNHA